MTSAIRKCFNHGFMHIKRKLGTQKPGEYSSSKKKSAFVKHFHFEGHLRSFNVIRRSKTEFVAANVFPGFLAFV